MSFKTVNYQFSSNLLDSPLYAGEFGGIVWKLQPRAQQFDSVEFLTIEIECLHEYKSSNLWSISAEIEVQVMNKYGEKATKMMDHLFQNGSETLDFGHFLAVTDFIYENERYLLKHELEYSLNIRINSIDGIDNLQSYDFLESKNNDSVIVLNVGDHKFYVDKFPLMVFSSVFREILSNDQDYEINIENADAKDVVEFLKLIYCQERKPDDYTENVLSLAVDYDVPFLVAEFEDFLINADEYTADEKLCIAVEFRLSKLQEYVQLNISDSLSEKYEHDALLAQELKLEKRIDQHKDVVGMVMQLEQNGAQRPQIEEDVQLEKLLKVQLSARSAEFAILVRQLRSHLQPEQNLEHEQFSKLMDHFEQYQPALAPSPARFSAVFEDTVARSREDAVVELAAFVTRNFAAHLSAQMAQEQAEYIARVHFEVILRSRTQQALTFFEEETKKMLLQSYVTNNELLRILKFVENETDREKRFEDVLKRQEDMCKVLEYLHTVSQEERAKGYQRLLIIQTSLNVMSLTDVSAVLLTLEERSKNTLCEMLNGFVKNSVLCNNIELNA